MNIVLFEADEIGFPLALADPRATHILKVLRREVGDAFDVGRVDGPKGKATLVAIGKESLEFSFEWDGEEEPALYPIDLIVGLSRPQTNRKILNEATSLGVRSMRFVSTDRSEPSYAQSKLWASGEWRRHLVAGAAQAFSTRLPEIFFGISLETALSDLESCRPRIALDNYEATESFCSGVATKEGLALAVGSERGWTARERSLFRESGYALAKLGERVLRTETAVVSALAIAISSL